MCLELPPTPSERGRISCLKETPLRKENECISPSSRGLGGVNCTTSETKKMAGIYLHIPFCKQACHYCNFHFSTSLKYKAEMLSAMLREIELQKEI